MNIKRIAIILSFLTIITATMQADEMREWVSKSGDTVEATLIKTSKFQIVLQTAAGKQVEIRKSQLSQQDLRYLDKLDALKEFDTVLKDNKFTLHGQIQQIIKNDIIVSNPMRVTMAMVPDPNDKVIRMEPTLIEKEILTPVTSLRASVLVLNAKKNLNFDGAKWAGTIYPCGVKMVEQRRRTYKCFTTNFSQARQMLLEKLARKNKDQFSPESQDPLAAISADAIRKLTASMKIIKKDPRIPKRIRMK